VSLKLELLEKTAQRWYGKSLVKGCLMKGADIFTAVLLTCLCMHSPAAEGQGEARLVADVESIQPGSPFQAGVLISMPENWHTYWLNPGDSGMAPEMKWRLPEGFTAGPALWPSPKSFDEPPIMSFGYEHEVLLFREIRPPAHLIANSNYTFGVNASWVVCKEVCVPKTAQLRLTLPSRAEPPARSAQWQPLFTRAKEELPVLNPAWRFRALADPKTISLYVTPPKDVGSRIVEKSVFFPAQPNFVEYGLPTWTRLGNEYGLRMKRVSSGEPLPARVQGVLVLPPGNKIKALEVNTSLQAITGER
jgi:thiol:disulfide interchange protein DsbD